MICPNKDILYLCNTQLHNGENMITEILFQIAIASASIMAAAILLATTKKDVPMTRKEVNLFYALHKKASNGCSHKMQPVTMKTGEFAGFQCECGYRYVQKRPLFSHAAKAPLETINGYDLAAYAGHVPTSAKS